MHSRSVLLRKNVFTLIRDRCPTHLYSTGASNDTPLDLTSIEEEPKYIEDLIKFNEKEVLRKRHKSRLSRSDRNRLFNESPYKEDIEWFHKTIRFKRRTLGRYGIDALNVSPGVVWPTKAEIEDKLEYEKLQYPRSIQEDWAEIAQQNKEKAEMRTLRDEDVAKKMAKVDQWRKDLEAKIAKKEAAILEVKQRKERIVEEVRRHFGFQIDPRDERFQQMLEKKEKEAKKLKKEAKKQEQTAKFMAKLLEQANINKKTQPKVDENSSETQVEEKK